MYQTFFIIISSILLIGCKDKSNMQGKLPYYNGPDFTPIFLKESSEVDRLITHSISNFSFLNQDSIFITQKEIENKIHIAHQKPKLAFLDRGQNLNLYAGEEIILCGGRYWIQ